MPRSKISKGPQSNSVAASFMHWKLREGKEDYMQMGKGKVGNGLQDS